MVILITGYKGFIGKNLSNQFISKLGIGENYDKEYIENFLNINNPDVVFHVGACSDTLNTDGKQPSNLYGWTKLLGEDYVVSKGGIALRYFNVYGPGEDHKEKMASIIYQNWNKNKVKLFPGNPKRDFVYVDDVISANLYALEHYEYLKGTWYEVGSGESNKFETIFDLLNTPYNYLDESQIPKGYQFHTSSNPENWMPGWKPKYTLEDGIKEYKKYLNEKS